MHAVMESDKGTIELEFFEKDAPKAVENFRLLAEHGYYDGLTFHRIVKGFMIQGGDPNGDGTGGESAWGGTFPDEIQRDSALYRRAIARGVIAMANSGPNTNGSQFSSCTRTISCTAAELRDLWECCARIGGGGRTGDSRDDDGWRRRDEQAALPAENSKGHDSPVTPRS
jgi:cyclophilin family peptidyl-prolyl cis-trans isomerase